MSCCTYLSAEQTAESLVWALSSEPPTLQAHPLPCVLQADLLSRGGTGA